MPFFGPVTELLIGETALPARALWVLTCIKYTLFAAYGLEVAASLGGAPDSYLVHASHYASFLNLARADVNQGPALFYLLFLAAGMWVLLVALAIALALLARASRLLTRRHAEVLRTTLYINLVLLFVPVNGLLIRMLVCTPFFKNEGPTSPGGYPQFNVPVVSQSAFWLDGNLLESLHPPAPHAHWQASGVGALFGGTQNCYSGYHLAHALLAAILLALNVLIMSLFAITKRQQPLGTRLHLGDMSTRTVHPGCHVYALADVVYECWTPLASVLTFSCIAEFVPRRVLGLYAFACSTSIILFFMLGGTSRTLLYEGVVLPCLISLSSVFFCAWYVSLGSVDGVDLGSTVAVMLFAGLFAGAAISLSRNGRIHLSTLESQRWSAHVLQWINLKTRAAAVSFMARQRRGSGAHQGSNTRQLEKWLLAWDPELEMNNAAIMAACRDAIRPTTVACRGALRRLLGRYPQSATAHLVAAEYLSSPVVSSDRSEQMMHVAAALRYSGGMPWHRIQCMQHLMAARQMHAGCVLACLQSRQARYDSEMLALRLCAERVHSVRANVMQLIAAAAATSSGKRVLSADVALLACVHSSMESVHSACMEVMAGLERHRSSKVVYERLVRRFVDMITVGTQWRQQQEAAQAMASGAGDVGAFDARDISAVRSNTMDKLGLGSPGHGGALLSPVTPYMGMGVRQQSSAGWLDAPTRRSLKGVFDSLEAGEVDDPHARTVSHAGSHLPESSGVRLPTDPRYLSSTTSAVAVARVVEGGRMATHASVGAGSTCKFVVKHSARGSVPRDWLMCAPNEVVLGVPGIWSGDSRLPRVLQQLQHVLLAHHTHEAYYMARSDSGGDAHAHSVNVGVHASRAAKHHCVLRYAPGGGLWCVGHTSAELLALLGLRQHAVGQLTLSALLGESDSGMRGTDLLQTVQHGCTVRMPRHGHQKASGTGEIGDSVLANVIAVSCWTGGSAGEHDVSVPAAAYTPARVSCSAVLLVEPVHVYRVSRRRGSAFGSSAGGSLALSARDCAAGAVDQPRTLTPVLAPSCGLSTPLGKMRVAQRQASNGSLSGTGSTAWDALGETGLASPGGLVQRQQEATLLRQRREVEREQTRVRHQLHRRVKHDKYSFRYMLGVASCIIAVSLYSLYTAYTVLGAGDNPLITLRFRHPATMAQLLPVGERVAAWSSALQALQHGRDTQGGSGWDVAQAAVSQQVRDLSEGTAQQVQLALSDAALLDASVGSSSVSQSWRARTMEGQGWFGSQTGSVSNASAHGAVGEPQSSLGQTEVLLASSFGVASPGQVPSTSVAGADSVSGSTNSTAHVAVGLLNAEFDGILRLRTVLAIFLTTSFTACTLGYTCFVEARLLQRTTDAVRSRQSGATGKAGSMQADGAAGGSRGVVGADLSLHAARERLVRQRGRSLASCCTSLLLRHVLFLQLAVAMALGISLIAVGFVRRLEPEDTQATSVNVVYATHQMQHASWRSTQGLDAMLAAGSRGDSTSAALATDDVRDAITAYASWQRVVFAGDDAGFMVSAAPGHTGAARYPSGTSGEELLYRDACTHSVGVLPSEREQRYMAPVNGSSTAASTHTVDCGAVLDGVLLDGWQVASRAYMSGMSDVLMGVQGLAAAGAGSSGGSNASLCLGAVRSSAWLRVGSRLSGSRGSAAVAAGTRDAMEWVVSACGSMWLGGGAAAQAWVARAGDLLRLQAVHFDELSRASVVHGIRGFLASLSRFAVESMLPVGCVPVWLLLFLWAVGSPTALSKRRTVQSAELMSALLRAHRAKETLPAA